MLVLSRNLGEGIFIGEDVIIRVVEVRGNKVRLGIEAPKSVTILREELRNELNGKLAKHNEASERE